MKNLYLTFLLLLGAFWTTDARASYPPQGEMFYQYIGDQPGNDSNEYRVYLTLYSQGPDTGFAAGEGLSLCLSRLSTSAADKGFQAHLVSPDSSLPAHLTMDSTNPYGWKDTGPHPRHLHAWSQTKGNSTGCAPSNDFGQYRYTGTVTVPSKAADWQFKMSSACCTDQYDNLPPGGIDHYSLSAELNTMIGHKSSPRFTSPANYQYCVAPGSAGSYVLEQTADGMDSIRYNLTGYKMADSSLTCNSLQSGVYGAGYSWQSPLPSSTPVSFDPYRGRLSFRPNQAGLYLISIEAEVMSIDTISGWIKTSSVQRDIPVRVVDSCQYLSTPEICMASIDPNDLSMRVHFSIDSTEATNIELFRQNATDPVGSLSVDSTNQSLSITDTSAPFLHPASLNYQLQQRTFCGNNTAPSMPHLSMGLSIRNDSTGQPGRLVWTAYQGRNVDRHRIYAVSKDLQTWQLLDSTAGNVRQLSLNFLPNHTHYLFTEAVLSDTSCLPESWSFEGPLGATSLYDTLATPDAPVNRVSVYPNPAHDHWQVSISQASSYQLFNAMGQQVRAGHWRPGEHRLSANELPEGPYFLKLEDQVKKIMISRRP